MRFNRVMSGHFFAVLAAGAGVGFLVGTLLSSTLYVTRSNSLAEELRHRSARVLLLEELVTRPPDFAALEPPEEVEQPSAPSPQPIQRPNSEKVVQRAVPLPAPVPMTPVTVVPSGEQGRITVTTPARVAAAVQPAPQPEEARQLPEATSVVAVGSRIEGVPASKAQVSKITAEGVQLSSGRLVRVGERFTSGERLLKVDPENNRFVTNERQLLIFFGS